MTDVDLFMDLRPGSLKRSSWEMEPPIQEPSVKRTPELTLESVPNELDDKTHSRLDDEVLKYLYPGQLEFNHPLATCLLAMIVSTSEGRLDPRYKEIPNSSALIEGHPGLMDKLRVALEAEQFREIRNLSAPSTS